jgi:threonine synthase
MLRAIRESRGGAFAVSGAELLDQAARANRLEGIDFCPEGGATIAPIRRLRESGVVHPGEAIVAFNTGGGRLYR